MYKHKTHLVIGEMRAFFAPKQNNLDILARVHFADIGK